MFMFTRRECELDARLKNADGAGGRNCFPERDEHVKRSLETQSPRNR